MRKYKLFSMKPSQKDALAEAIAKSYLDKKRGLADWLTRKESRLSLQVRKWLFIVLFTMCACYCAYLLISALSAGAAPSASMYMPPDEMPRPAISPGSSLHQPHGR